MIEQIKTGGVYNAKQNATRLYVILENAIDLLLENVFTKEKDRKNLEEMFEELGTTEEELKQFGIEFEIVRVCPICGKTYKEPPSISRKDNKTEICSECGTAEALEAYQNAMKEKEGD